MARNIEDRISHARELLEAARAEFRNAQEARGGAAVTGQILTGSGNFADGVACFDDLAPGNYVFKETAPLPGYASVPDQPVTVVGGNTCASNPTVVNILNDPLSRITVLFESQAGAGVTGATINCARTLPSAGPLFPDTTDSDPTLFNDTNEVYSNLRLGTIVCTIVIDP